MALDQIKVLAGILFLSGTGIANAQSSPVHLTGKMILPPGVSNAMAIINYLQPKPATRTNIDHSNWPPRCFADTDGNFEFKSIGAGVLCGLSVVAPGCVTQTFTNIDATGGLMKVALKSLADSDRMTGRVLRGRALDPDGKPVANALVQILEVTRDKNWTWNADQIDRYTVTDSAGEFLVPASKPFDDAGGCVKAPGLAVAVFHHLKPDAEIHTVQMIRGAALSGRISDAKGPVAFANLHLDRFGADDLSMAWLESAKTDADGRFLFEHLPANRVCRLSGNMGEMGVRGSIPETTARIPGDGSTNDLGDIKLARVFKIDGKIKLSDGKSIPVNSTIFCGSFDSGFSKPFDIGDDGAFELTGVPEGKLRVYLRLPGYELTPNDRFLKMGTGTNLVIAQNISNWTIELQPESHANMPSPH